MFEVWILCRRLSSSSSILGHSNNNNNNNTTKKNVEQQIKDYKRQSLAKTLEEYELEIEENESLYQEELLRLFEKDELLRQQSDQTENFINCLNTYLKQRIDARIRRIRYKETIFRIKLSRPRHRYSQPSTSLIAANRTTNVYPEVIIEVSETDQQQQRPFTDKELALLSSAGILILFYSNQKFCLKQNFWLE